MNFYDCHRHMLVIIVIVFICIIRILNFILLWLREICNDFNISLIIKNSTFLFYLYLLYVLLRYNYFFYEVQHMRA